MASSTGGFYIIVGVGILVRTNSTIVTSSITKPDIIVRVSINLKARVIIVKVSAIVVVFRAMAGAKATNVRARAIATGTRVIGT